MTKYAYLTDRIKNCRQKAEAHRSDIYLYVFYMNAALGFLKRRETMGLEEAGQAATTRWRSGTEKALQSSCSQ